MEMRIASAIILAAGITLITSIVERAAAADKPDVAFITSTSRLGDKGFNDAVAAGVAQAAAEWGLKTTVVQSNTDTDYVPNLTRAAEAGYKVIMVAGYQMGDAVREVAPQFPDVKFGAVDVQYDTPINNVREILFHEEQPSYLLGVLSASIIKGKSAPKVANKNALGVVAGVEQPAVNRFITGYVCGARSVDPSIPIYIYFTGTWQDPALFKEAAVTGFNRGAGAIFEIGGVAGLAVIEASKELGFLEMTTDQDKNQLSPTTVLSSSMKNLQRAAYLTIKDVVDDKWKGGQYLYSLANGGVEIADLHQLSTIVNPETRSSVDKAKAAIADGSLVVPRTLDEGKACLSGVEIKRPK
jgi:basic membrane protein A